MALALASWGRAAGASGPPVCTTTQVIAIPTGLGESFPSIDKDGDGLVDAAEDELAACAMPKYFFDSAEPALGPNEPQMLYSVVPGVGGAQRADDHHPVRRALRARRWLHLVPDTDCELV